VFLQSLLGRRLIWTRKSIKNSAQNVFEIGVQNISALENLEDKLHKDCAFRIVHCDSWLKSKHCLIRDLNNHLNGRWILQESVLSINKVIVESFDQGVAKTVLVFDEYLL